MWPKAQQCPLARHSQPGQQSFALSKSYAPTCFAWQAQREWHLFDEVHCITSCNCRLSHLCSSMLCGSFQLQALPPLCPNTSPGGKSIHGCIHRWCFLSRIPATFSCQLQHRAIVREACALKTQAGFTAQEAASQQLLTSAANLHFTQCMFGKSLVTHSGLKLPAA